MGKTLSGGFGTVSTPRGLHIVSARQIQRVLQQVWQYDLNTDSMQTMVQLVQHVTDNDVTF